MAIDTRNKRASLLGLGGLEVGLMPSPDGAIDAEDKRQLAGMYPGFAEDGGGEPEGERSTYAPQTAIMQRENKKVDRRRPIQVKSRLPIRRS